MNVEEYYRRYVISGHDAGEHHFVAVCLCPTIKRILNIYPDYVNPDGMKRKHGDLIYKIQDSKVGIEVKLKTIQLTSNQQANDYSPKYLLALQNDKILMAEWDKFKARYNKIREERKRLGKGEYKEYGPSVDINEFESCGQIINPIITKKVERVLRDWL